ncbi:MAG: lantibiotic dehydratase [Thermomicrobiales bacterium]
MTTMTSAHSLFEPTNYAMIRVPLLPVNALAGWLEMSARGRATSSGTALCDPEDAQAHGVDTTNAWLCEKLGDPLIQEAILVGSPDLFQSIERWKREPESKKGRHARANLLRYLIRLMTRPTPFGLFAGVGLAHAGSRMDIRIGQPEYNGKRTRPDMQWLLYYVHELEQRPEVASHLQFFTNPVSFASGGRLYFPYLDSYGQAETEKVASLRATPAAMDVLARARRGATLDALEQHLFAIRPDVRRERIRALVDGLRQQGALLSELRPPLTGRDPLQYVLKTINHLPGCDDIRGILRSVSDKARDYDAQRIGQGAAQIQSLSRAMPVPDKKIRSLLQVDMHTAVERNTVSASVLAGIAQAAEIMLRVSTIPPQLGHLAVYRGEFIERYGTEREVPLLELLDEDVGLGPPPTYQHPPRVGGGPPVMSPQYVLRERTLMELVAKALVERRREISLDEDTLARLTVVDSWSEKAPASLDLYVSIAASSQQAIDRGEYSIVIMPRVGIAPAGCSFGRFHDILGDETANALSELVRIDECQRPDSLFAELVYLPTSGHAANVIIRPASRRHEITMAVSPGIEQCATIPMDDLVVGIRGDRFYLRSVSRDAEVIVRSTHLLNYSGAPNVCRFLSEIAIDGLLHLHMFDWGAASRLPFLPRLTVGRVVLRPAEWHLPTTLAEPSRPQEELSHSLTWYQRVQDWRHDWDVPRYVYLAVEDNRLLLDLEHPLSVADLGEECRQQAAGQGTVTLQEVLPALEDAWAEGIGGNHQVEFVVPLVRRDRSADAEPLPRKHAKTDISERLRLPGSDWLYAKLYCGRTRQDDLLAGPIREFVDAIGHEGVIDNWFFVRYGDPDSHIRLRFHGESSVLLTNLLPVLGSWSQALAAESLIHKLVIDSYEREIERYGGLEGTQIAERIFGADSVTILDVLALGTQHLLDLSPRDVAMVTVDDLLVALGLQAPDRLAIYRGIRPWQEKAFAGQIARLRDAFHDHRKVAQRLVGDRAWLREQPGGRDLEQCLRDRGQAIRPLGERLRTLAQHNEMQISLQSFLDSCIHMHCNRLLGLDRLREFEVIYYLERTYESLERYAPKGISIP